MSAISPRPRTSPLCRCPVRELSYCQFCRTGWRELMTVGIRWRKGSPHKAYSDPMGALTSKMACGVLRRFKLLTLAYSSRDREAKSLAWMVRIVWHMIPVPLSLLTLKIRYQLLQAPIEPLHKVFELRSWGCCLNGIVCNARYDNAPICLWGSICVSAAHCKTQNRLQISNKSMDALHHYCRGVGPIAGNTSRLSVTHNP